MHIGVCQAAFEPFTPDCNWDCNWGLSLSPDASACGVKQVETEEVIAC